MRKQSIVNSFKTALVALPLLASCGGNVGTAQVLVDPSGLMLPDCQDGQLIGVNTDKSLTCVSPPSAVLPPAACAAGQALTGVKNAGTGQIEQKCVSTGSGLNDVTTQTRITKATTDITNLQTMVTQITSGGGTRSRYVGATTGTSNGNVLAPGALQGIRAGNSLCATEFGVNSHVCTPFEIYESVVVGDVLNGTADVGPLMVYMEAWIPPFAAGGSEPNAGVSENCGGFTYDTADRKWRNTHFTFAVPSGGTVRVPRFNAAASCNTAVRLACCK
jgi:hypothetical protein